MDASLDTSGPTGAGGADALATLDAVAYERSMHATLALNT